MTAALAFTGKSPLDEAAPYAAAQCAGAFVAAAINYVIFAPGIAAMEASQKIVRGTAASTASRATVTPQRHR